MSTTREKIEVMEAHERGEEVEAKYRLSHEEWTLAPSPKWDWTHFAYRIKPKGPREFWVIRDRIRRAGALGNRMKIYDISESLSVNTETDELFCVREVL